ncbi:MAG TPA: hypothetical protein VFA56_05995 [Gaiellaceae bacterium]|nr:hypothetical protein [Gaiellaceae bacterium]
MGSRLLPLALALSAFVADATGLHHVASYLVLLAVVGAGAAAFVAVGEWIEGKGGLVRAGSTTLALGLLLVGSAVRFQAPLGHVPVVAISTLVLAAVVYCVPLVLWLLEPLAPKPQPRLRTHP